MKRKHKQYSRPKRPFEKSRIQEEAVIKKKYGLKNKKEIWRADAKISSIRSKAKKLISSSQSEQKIFFEQLKKIGFRVNSISDVLSLTKEDYLNRRLQTVVLNKKLATTPKMARQLITHKKVLVNGRAINSPSYIVSIELENKITLKSKKIKKQEIKQEEKPHKVEEESSKENKSAEGGKNE
jgi:small subunit ribosomal protein S4